MKLCTCLLTAALAIPAFASTANAQTADASFGYPVVSAGCNDGCGVGGGHFFNGQVRAKLDHQSALNAKRAARNDAWPKPFTCWDRQAYHSFWSQYLDSGMEQRCVLSADWFDPQTNQLNNVGVNYLAGIMRNVPEHERTVYIQRVGNDNIDQARQQEVMNTINRYYAHHGVAKVAFSNRQPSTVSGQVSEALNEKRLNSLADPMIQIGTGGSVNAAVSGQ